MGWHVMTVALAFRHNFCSNLLNRFRVDVTHLSLYNLSVIHKKKYFDSEMHLMTYINDNWELLQLGEVRKKLGVRLTVKANVVFLFSVFLLLIVNSGCLSLQLTNTPRSERYQNILEALNNNSNMWVIVFLFSFTHH